jgi:hypothetical protein
MLLQLHTVHSQQHMPQTIRNIMQRLRGKKHVYCVSTAHQHTKMRTLSSVDGRSPQLCRLAHQQLLLAQTAEQNITFAKRCLSEPVDIVPHCKLLQVVRKQFSNGEVRVV